jgi:glutaredoxin
MRRNTAEGIQALQKSYRLFQQSKAEGSDFKQAVADAIAGEYDKDAVTAEVKALASSAPLVLFTWESSPSCTKAIKYLAEVQGVQPTIVRLDDPWSKGNPMRAALGKLTGRSSVPSIWIGGEYVGGYEDGPSADAPGLAPLAFRNQLYPKLEAAGAFDVIGTIASNAKKKLEAVGTDSQQRIDTAAIGAAAGSTASTLDLLR